VKSTVGLDGKGHHGGNLLLVGDVARHRRGLAACSHDGSNGLIGSIVIQIGHDYFCTLAREGLGNSAPYSNPCSRYQGHFAGKFCHVSSFMKAGEDAGPLALG
jgi:hypothetical protein